MLKGYNFSTAIPGLQKNLIGFNLAFQNSKRSKQCSADACDALYR